MLIITRSNHFIYFYDQHHDRYVIETSTGKPVDQSNTKAVMDAAWRRVTR